LHRGAVPGVSSSSPGSRVGERQRSRIRRSRDDEEGEAVDARHVGDLGSGSSGRAACAHEEHGEAYEREVCPRRVLARDQQRREEERDRPAACAPRIPADEEDDPGRVEALEETVAITRAVDEGIQESPRSVVRNVVA